MSDRNRNNEFDFDDDFTFHTNFVYCSAGIALKFGSEPKSATRATDKA